MFDVMKYAALLLEVFQLEERLRKNPPDDVAEYTAAVMDIKALWDEIHAMVSAGNVTPGDIQAAHLRNQATWDASPDPRYDNVFFSKPDDADYQSGDRVMRTDDSSAWRVEEKNAAVIGWGGAWVLDHVVP